MIGNAICLSLDLENSGIKQKYPTHLDRNHLV